MAKLCVNIDHVATVRQARRTIEPEPVAAAIMAELAGAHGITVHLREDRRHINDRDVRLLREVVKTKLNLEMAPTEEMVKIALSLRPEQATLVPERREEVTTEGGLEVEKNLSYLTRVIKTLQEGEIPVSLFITPDVNQVKAAHRSGANMIEIHTGKYSHAKTPAAIEEELEHIANVAKLAYKIGLGVNAGHGLNYQNVTRIDNIREISELNIGHSIISRALLVGLDRAVRDMLDLLRF
jgi:pyridoxine 5-phosphate synthase